MAITSIFLKGSAVFVPLLLYLCTKKLGEDTAGAITDVIHPAAKTNETTARLVDFDCLNDFDGDTLAVSFNGNEATLRLRLDHKINLTLDIDDFLNTAVCVSHALQLCFSAEYCNCCAYCTLEDDLTHLRICPTKKRYVTLFLPTIRTTKNPVQSWTKSRMIGVDEWPAFARGMSC